MNVRPSYWTVNLNVYLLQNQHTKEKQYNCTMCMKVFHKLQNLKKHLQTHTGVRDYFCSQCHRGFQSKYHLKRHASTCKGKSGPSPSQHRPPDQASVVCTTSGVCLTTSNNTIVDAASNAIYVGTTLYSEGS